MLSDKQLVLFNYIAQPILEDAPQNNQPVQKAGQYGADKNSIFFQNNSAANGKQGTANQMIASDNYASKVKILEGELSPQE